MSAYRAPRGPGNAADPPYRVVLYYSRNGVVVTDRYITDGLRRYETGEIAGLAQVKDPVDAGVKAAAMIGVVGALVVGPFVLAAHSPFAWLLAVVALAVPFVVAATWARRRPRQLRLIARYRGRVATLFATEDPQEYGKVERAVQRAVERAQLRVLDW